MAPNEDRARTATRERQRRHTDEQRHESAGAYVAYLPWQLQQPAARRNSSSGVFLPWKGRIRRPRLKFFFIVAERNCQPVESSLAVLGLMCRNSAHNPRQRLRPTSQMCIDS